MRIEDDMLRVGLVQRVCSSYAFKDASAFADGPGLRDGVGEALGGPAWAAGTEHVRVRPRGAADLASSATRTSVRSRSS